MVHILCVNTWFVLYVLIHGSCCMCLDMFMIVVFDNSVLPGKSPCIYGIHPAWYLHISSEKSDVWNSQIAYGDLEVWWPSLSHGFLASDYVCLMAHLLVTCYVCLWHGSFTGDILCLLAVSYIRLQSCTAKIVSLNSGLIHVSTWFAVHLGFKQVETQT